MFNKLRTFQQQLVVQQALVWLEIKRIQRQIADFLSFKIDDSMLDVTLVMHCRVQLGHYVFQPVKVISIPLQVIHNQH